MANLDELIVKIEADNKELKAALEESAKVTARSTKQMEDAITKFAESASKETSNLDNVMNVFAGTTLANILVSATNMAKEALGELWGLFKEGVQGAAEAEQQTLRLANSLASTGKYSQGALESLTKFADEMERTTGIEGEAITKNLALLSSMTRLSGEGLERAQTAAINLSSAMGIDLDTATKMVGKAAEGSTDAFGKYGIKIQETADKNLTFANTLAEIEKRFGGAAAGNMQSFQGALAGLKNAFEDVFKALGEVVVKNPAVIATIGELGKVFNSIKDSIEGSAGDISKTISSIVVTTTQGLAAITGVVEKLVQIFQAGFQTILTITGAVGDSFQWLADKITGNTDRSGKAFEETGKRFEILEGIVNKDSSAISDKLYEIASTAETAAITTSESFGQVVPTIKNATAAVTELGYAQKLQLEAATEFAVKNAEAATSVTEGYALQQEALTASYEAQLISFETFKEAKLSSQLEQFEREQAMLTTALEAKKITQEQYDLATIQAQAKSNVDRMKLTNDLKKQEDQVNALRLGGYSTFFSGLASLSQSGNDRLNEIAKGAAIGKATIDAYLAIQNALATVPYPANFAAAAGIGIQAFANVSKIAGVGLASGIDSVPGVGSKDNFNAVLAPNERVVPAKTNEDLTDFLANQNNGSPQQTIININFNGLVAGNPSDIGAQIVEYINEAQARGMSLSLRTS